MNIKNTKNLESGQRCRQWTIDYVALIPVGSNFETVGAAMVALVNLLETLAGEIQSFVGEGLSATDVKTSERLDLLEIMERIRHAARGAEDTNPGTRDRYRYTTTMSAQALLAAGRSFAAGSLNDKDLLVDWGAPDTWNVDITTACDAYEASFGQQDSAVGGRIATNADFADKLADLVATKATYGHMVKNFAFGKPGAQAAWTAAAHVEAAPKKKKPTPPTPPTP